MKYCPSLAFRQRFLRLSLAAALSMAGALAGLKGRARAAELVEWVRNIQANSALGGVFFRSVALPSGPLLVRRPPKETRPALTQLMATEPSNADLLALRAREDEQQLDVVAAEADWKKYAQTARNTAEAQIALADFYHRRLRPLDEVKALAAAAQAPPLLSERFMPPSGQRSWQLFQRILQLTRDQALPATLASAQYRAWMARYPRERQAYAQYFDFLLDQRQLTEAEQLLATYQKVFPKDVTYAVQARAQLQYRSGSVDAALALYDRSFQPLWPPELVKSYFDLLQKTHHLGDFLARARAAVAANPDDLGAAARIFYYYQQQGNFAEAQRALTELRLRKESSAAAGRVAWSAEGLFTLAQLFESMNNGDEAARYYYALYSLPGADEGTAEKALAGIIRVLFSMPEQRIEFGSGDFSFYRDVATADPYPGFLNGILSLVLNTTWPSGSYANEARASVAYFHRTRATELVSLFDSRFPKSADRVGLHAKLVEAYAAYGANDGVIRAGREFVATFPHAPERTRVALLMADAFARKSDPRGEFATYDALLKELAAQADGIPLGSIQEEEASAAQPGPPYPQAQVTGVIIEDRASRSAALSEAVPAPQSVAAASLFPRSPEYARVLDRYIARLVSMNRVPEVLELYRREIDRNPDDPGLYERLAAFMSQNYLGEEVEQVYRLAMQHFPDRSWYDKLARWYLRRRMIGQLDQLTHEVMRTFSGTDLENYFRQVIGSDAIGPTLYLQLNLYAHERFPHNLTFVRNLLAAYARHPTADAAAWERLVRRNWFYDDELRSQFFAYLSGTKRLDAELQALSTASRPSGAGSTAPWVELNPAAAQFVAEAEVWRSHFEQAAPPVSALAVEYPADASLGQRAADVNRSLASLAPLEQGQTGARSQTSAERAIETAVAIEENLHRYAPGDHAALTRIGEIYADREMYGRARSYWDMLPQIEPGKPDSYLEAATVFWDYFRFDDAVRLIEAGRKQFSDPTLYAYQAGAIYENKRDFARAVEEYVKGALAEKLDSSARSRLLKLARRQALRSRVDEATAQAVAGANPRLEAISLRVAVLQAQERRDDLEQLLARLADGATTVELEESVGQIAEQQGFHAVRERSLKRQIALTADLVDAMRLRLVLARCYEGRGDIDSARGTMEALYHDKPTILGVVRAAVDFYWRNKMPDRAIALLQGAAAAAYPDLRKRFTLEAARKSIDSAQFAKAKELVAGLLHDEPFNAEYLATLADAYAHAGDDRGLRDFYLSTIQSMGQAPLPADERMARVAAMRRGLIPALTRLKDYASAVEHYVEIINQYPEDAGLIEEAASYAERYKRDQQLVGYYAKAATDSPRDFRWPMVRAQLAAYFEDFPAAIAALNQAIQIRPDRSDFYVARAGIEERLARFDEAAQSYANIYELTYHNPQWMEKIAEIRARQGQTDAAVEALTRALVEGRPERPETFFEVARRLESWNMLPQARQYAERGLDLAASKLFIDSSVASGGQVYPRVMTRLREQEAAYARLMAVWKATTGEDASKKADPDLRQFELANFQAALKEMGATADRYFTPEEKSAFQAFLEGQKAKVSLDEFADAVVPVAESTGLAAVEARWRYELMMVLHSQRGTHMSRLIELQSGRMKFAELGQQLEAYAQVVPPEERETILARAARMYESAEEPDNELRVLSTLVEHSGAAGQRDRYFTLLRAHHPQNLSAIAAGRADAQLRDAATNFAVASGDEGLALNVLAARGRSEPTVWKSAFTGLVGLYYADPSAPVRMAFAQALNVDAPIGARLGKPADRTQQLAGSTWFYYGSRYGEYLDVTRQDGAEDFLPAELEATPGSASAYFNLGDYYRECGHAARAVAEFDHTLELDPLRGEAHDRVATILWKQGKRDDAAARWKAALQAFTRQEDKGRLSEEFWENVRTTLAHIGEHRLLPVVHEDADRLLRTYVRRNGWYRVEPLLRGAMAASGDPAAGVAWIIDLARSDDNPLGFLQSLVDADWIPHAQREAVFRRILELAEVQARGDVVGYAQSVLDDWRLRWIEYLVRMKLPQAAREALNALSPDARKARQERVTLLEVQIAAQAKDLGALLARYGSDPDQMPPVASLLKAATELRKADDAASARRVLEFAYTYELERHNFAATNFLGLAEVRLEESDVRGALALLRRLVLVVGEPFENLGPAADLLEKYGREPEAVGFLSQLVKATPWDAAARVRLAKAQLTANASPAEAVARLSVATGQPEASYETRVSAAIALGGVKKAAPKTGSAELDGLASGVSDPTHVEKPFFYAARVEAAKQATDAAVRMRLLLGALDINPRAKAPRLPLLFAAAKTGHFELAVSAAEAAFETKFYGYALRDWSEDQRRSPNEDLLGPADEFRAALGVDAGQAAAAAGMLGEAYERLDHFSAAEFYFRIALQLEPAGEGAELRRHAKAVKAERECRALNAKRRPHVSSSLDQADRVRPRLAAPAPKGGGQ